jgi:hypothetical protein
MRRKKTLRVISSLEVFITLCEDADKKEEITEDDDASQDDERCSLIKQDRSARAKTCIGGHGWRPRSSLHGIMVQ